MLAGTSWAHIFAGGTCKLLNTGQGTQGRYIALSYCWGSGLAFKTTKNNQQSHYAGFSFNHLPQTLQDAVYITRYLGLRYIWIDCLCIIQDDKADWEREASLMAQVYSNAYLTIAATRAPNCDAGFLGDRNTQFDQITIQDDKGSFELYFSYLESEAFAPPGAVGSNDPIADLPLSSRVWTFQERILPPRTLHYAEKQMYWECSQAYTSEENEDHSDINHSYRLSDIIKSLDTRKPLHYRNRTHWYNLIEEYSSRNMTYQSDKLPALSGVVSAIQRATGDTYYAGIWREHFIEGLLWSVDPSDVFLRKPASRPEKWRAPSWSFAAIEGSIKAPTLYTDYCAEMQECEIVVSGGNPYGEVKSGYARIRGPVTSVEIAGEDAFSLRLRGDVHVQAKVYFDLESYTRCEALMLHPFAGLAIVCTEGDGYVRVGMIEVEWDSRGRVLEEGYDDSISIILL